MRSLGTGLHSPDSQHFWGWYPTALEVILHLDRKLTRATNGKEGMVVPYLRQRLGVLLMQDNVAMLGSQVRSFIPKVVDEEAHLG